MAPWPDACCHRLVCKPYASNHARPVCSSSRMDASPGLTRCVGPAQRSRRRRPHRSCTLSSNACGHTSLRQDATRARPARTTIPLSPPTALAVAHGETMVLHTVVDGGRLRPRLACSPPEVPTRGQGAHILAARSWHHASCCGLPPHRSAALPREASASVAAVCSGIVLAL